MHCTLSALSSPAFAHWLLLSAVPQYGIMRSCRIQRRGFIRVMAEHRCCTGECWKMTVMLGYKLTPESFWMQGCACVCVDLVRFYFVDMARSSGSHSKSWRFLPSTDVYALYGHLVSFSLPHYRIF